MKVRELIQYLQDCPTEDNVELGDQENSQYLGWIDNSRPESDGEGVTVVYVSLDLPPWQTT